MANDLLILGNIAPSGSLVTNDRVLFSIFESASNFEVPDFVASASGEISFNNSTFGFNHPISSSALTINNVYLETTESSISAGNTTLGEFPTASYKAIHVDYLITSGSSKARAGYLVSTWKGNSVTFTDTSAKSIGNTLDAEFSVILNGANADLKISSSDSYDVTISSRGILDGTNFALGGGVYSKSPFPFTGSAIITGSLDITGSIIPGDDGIYDLGDATHFWRTASIEHIVTLGDTIEFRDKDNKNTIRGTLKLDTQGGLKVRGSNNALTVVSASHGHFTGDMNVAGDLAISGISDVSASIAEAFNNGGNVDTGSLVLTSSFNTFTSSIQSEVDTLTSATSSYLTSIPSTYFNSSLLTTENISKNFNYTSSLNVAEITSSVEGAIIDYRLTNLDSGSRVGTFMYAHDGTTLSYNDLTVPGAGIGGDPTLSATLDTGSSIVSIDIENAAGFNFSGFAKKFSKLDNAIPVADPNVSYILDISPSENALAAYSVRQLSTLYTGPAMKVRRTSDNVELDIYYDVNGELDTAAIETHCGSNLGRVTVWYDQSGNNNHISESNASYQPTIWSGTVIYTAGNNNKPALQPAGAFPLTTQNITPEGLTIVTEMGNHYDVLLAGSSYSDKIRTALGRTHLLFEGAGTTLQIPIDGGYEGYNLITLNKNTQWEGKTNNNPIVTGTATGDFTVQCLFARNPGGNSSTNDGRGQEFIFWENEQSQNQANLQNNANNYYGIYDTGLLEDYSGAAAAYSVRQLSTAFTSSMNIRRASDNTEQVIGFTANGDLDTGSIETFCAGTECYVDTWYDQSGNGNDAEQATAGKQPLIYSASAVIIENNKPALNFDGSNDVLKKQFTSTLSQPGHVYATATNNITNFSNYIVLFSGYNNSNTRWQTEVRTTTGYLNMYAGSSNESTTTISTTQSLHNNYYSGSNSNYRLNGTNIATGNAGTFSTDGLTIGARFNEIYHWNGTMQELIIWPTSQSNAIETNINSYFNIY